MKNKSEKSKLEKRIGAFCKQKENYKPISSLDELRARFNEYDKYFIEFAKKKFPMKYLSILVDWDKFKDVYKKGTDMLLEECGDGMVKELQVVEKAKKLTDKEFQKKLPELIIEVYGSFSDYECFGKSLKHSEKKLVHFLEGTKFSLIERLTIKPFCKYFIKQLGKTGQYIIDAGKEARNSCYT